VYSLDYHQDCSTKIRNISFYKGITHKTLEGLTYDRHLRNLVKGLWKLSNQNRDKPSTESQG